MHRFIILGIQIFVSGSLAHLLASVSIKGNGVSNLSHNLSSLWVITVGSSIQTISNFVMAIGSAVMVIGFWEMRSKSSKGASYSSAAMELPEEKREEFQKWLSEDAARSYLPKSVQLSSFLNSTGQV